LLAASLLAALPLLASAQGGTSCDTHPRDYNALVRDSPGLLRACGKLIDSHRLRGSALADAYVGRAMAQAGKRDFARAVADLDAALLLRPGKAADIALRGVYRYQGGDRSGAIADYSRALSIAPDGDTYANRGVSYLDLNDFPAAVQDFRLALEIHPDSAAYLLRRGLAWRGLGQYARAVDDFSAAIARGPVEEQTWCDRGISLFYAARFDAAIADLEKCPVSDTENYGYMRIWRYIAQVRGATGAVPTLGQFSAELADSSAIGPGWPAPVRELLLERITPEALLAAPTKDGDQTCEAAYYAGQYHLLHGNPGAARPLFAKVLPQCSRTLLEYQGAVSELKRME
jgi:tetratricopeptide (TPR) repeat protein